MEGESRSFEVSHTPEPETDIREIEGVDIATARQIIQQLKVLNRSTMREFARGQELADRLQSDDDKSEASRQTKANMDYNKLRTVEQILALLPEEEIA